MTIRQVMKEVLALLSLKEESAAPLFFASLNRALDEICREFPKRAVERIYHAPLAPRYAFCEEKTVSSASPLRITAEGIYSFAFTAYGAGSVTVAIDGTPVAEYTVTEGTPLSVAEGLSALGDRDRGTVTVSFYSNKRLYLTSFALYDRPSETVTPYGAFSTYPVSAFAHRFLAFDGVATKNTRAVDEGTLAYGEDAVYLRFDARGVYDVPYLALADPASEDSLDRELVMRHDAIALVPLLTAHYLAIEDESPLSALLLSRYEAIRASLLAKRGEETVGDVYSW